jgi:AbrB family looped-hinge helix DNA binding protein
MTSLHGMKSRLAKLHLPCQILLTEGVGAMTDMVELAGSSKVSPEGRVSIPAEVRRLLRLKAGDRVNFLVDRQESIVHLVTPRLLVEVLWSHNAPEGAVAGGAGAAVPPAEPGLPEGAAQAGRAASDEVAAAREVDRLAAGQRSARIKAVEGSDSRDERPARPGLIRSRAVDPSPIACVAGGRRADRERAARAPRPGAGRQ